MAYDPPASEPHQAAYTSSYPSFFEDGKYDSRYERSAPYPYPVKGRSRASSSVASGEGQQPIQHAIGNAFDRSDAARVVDPSLIAQITAEVKRSVLQDIKSGVLDQLGQPGPGPVPAQQHPPPKAPGSVPPRDVYTPPSPNAEFANRHFASVESVDEYDDLTPDIHDDTPTPRFERSAPIDIPPHEQASVRPTAPRLATDDYTPIEKMWQRLFSPDGQPLPRLGQFLRGLALHLVEDYEPKNSLVIQPHKMLAFYEEVQLDDEIFPWQTIFGKLPYSSLGKIYRDMRCQHHLIQEHPAEQPYIPALTPEGFQEWMTAMIQAYPDIEYRRLAKAVLNMPISNADDRKERFPKQLPRRLFPDTANLQAQQRCAANLAVDGCGPLRQAATFPPPPPKDQPNTSVPPMERERSPYATRADSKDFESQSEDEFSPSVPIERQRKPYSAAPGGGKLHEDEIRQNMPTEPSSPHKRRQSDLRQSQYSGSLPKDQYYHPHPTSATHGGHRRPRSPSLPSYGSQSEPTVRDVPNMYYTSNMKEPGADTRRYSKDSDGGSKRYEHHRKSTAGMDGSFDAQPHRRSTAGMDGSFDSQPRSIYDDDDHRGRGTGNSGYGDYGYGAQRF